MPLDTEIELDRRVAERTATRTSPSMLARFQPSAASGKLVEEA
jgi:hypothetical protein